MSTVFSLLFCLCVLSGVANSPDLNGIRSEFHRAALDEKYIHAFHQQISTYSPDFPVILAYKAASEALVAQQTWNPLEKYQQLCRFENLIMEAVNKDPANIEIRFVRFSVQYYIPRFLGFSNHLTADKQFILENIEKIKDLNLDPAFSRYIIYFLKETGLYDQESVRFTLTQ